VLGLATAAIDWMNEILVTAIEPTTKDLGLGTLLAGYLSSRKSAIRPNTLRFSLR
jgi:hypothetical protein